MRFTLPLLCATHACPPHANRQLSEELKRQKAALDGARAEVEAALARVSTSSAAFDEAHARTGA